ncbi:MAG: lysozyme inhibitor LprI family protein, partial [Pontixanthobacter sp.]
DRRAGASGVSFGAAFVLLTQALPYGGAECDQAIADSGVQFELNVCAWREHEGENKKLNAAWAKAREHAKFNDAAYRDSTFYREDDEGRYFALLLAEQRAWLQFRDMSCAVAADKYRNGSMRPMVYSKCMTQMTKDRTVALEAYLGPDY